VCGSFGYTPVPPSPADADASAIAGVDPVRRPAGWGSA
jgi:hypothetical protein